MLIKTSYGKYFFGYLKCCPIVFFKPVVFMVKQCKLNCIYAVLMTCISQSDIKC